jgi:ketosteroid isomerase-like protein
MKQRVTPRVVVMTAILFVSISLRAQNVYDPLAQGAQTEQPNLLTQPTLSSGAAFLFSLEAKFAAEVATGGGKAFASWFAEDGMTMANGKSPVYGRAAIAAQSVWSPKEYQLTWTPAGGQLNATGDMGFTYGHYDGHSRDAQGNTVVIGGRYMTVWKKQSNGEWKVELEASQDEPKNDCCSIK